MTRRWRDPVEGRLCLRNPSEEGSRRLCSDVLSTAEIVLLARWGLLRLTEGRPQWPGDGTLAALWQDCKDEIVVNATSAEFSRYRHVRRALCIFAGAPSEALLRKVIDHADGRPVTSRMMKALIGTHGTEAVRRARETQGRSRRAYPRVGSADLETFLAILPEGARPAVLEAFDEEVLPPIRPPRPAHMARVLRLRGDAARMLGLLRLLQPSLDRRTPASAFDNLARVERFDDITEGREQRCGEAVARAWEKYAAGELLTEEPERARLRTAAKYCDDLRAARATARSALGPAAEEVIARLPALHPDEKLFAPALRARLSSMDEAKRERKAEGIVSLVPSTIDLLTACENRFHQLLGVANAFLAALKGGELELLSGEAAGIRWKGRVVRPDGQLGVGEQELMFQTVREDDLVRSALARDPANQELARLAERVEADPLRAARLHLVYDCVRGIGPAAERHEPWFVDLYRCDVFGSAHNLSPVLAARRRDHLSRTGLTVGMDPPAGFLSAQGTARRTLDGTRRSDPHGTCVVVPILGLIHAMLCARILIRMSVRWGARMAETRQLRSGCLFKKKVGGVSKPFASLKPKGWIGQGVFGIDEETVAALRQLKLLAHHRWFSDCVDEDGEPSVPIAPFASPHRNDLPPARYLLRARGGLIRTEHLRMFVLILLSGVMNLATHDGRKLFATAMGVAGSGYSEVREALHHSPDSDAVKLYDLSARVLALQNADEFNSYLDARMHGLASLA